MQVGQWLELVCVRSVQLITTSLSLGCPVNHAKMASALMGLLVLQNVTVCIEWTYSSLSLCITSYLPHINFLYLITVVCLFIQGLEHSFLLPLFHHLHFIESCAAGSQRKGDKYCETCGVDTYKNRHDGSSCLPCKRDETTGGKMGATECSCKFAFLLILGWNAIGIFFS